MIEFNSDKLRQPLYAGITGAVFMIIYIFVIRKWKEQKKELLLNMCVKDLYIRPALIVGAITATVMYLANGPGTKALSEPFE